jgi:arylsulfatase A-like enzyme
MVLVVIPVACGGSGGQRGRHSVPRQSVEARLRRPNVVLVVADTLRADHLPFYGYARETAPFLARLAASGAVFEQAASTSSWTAPATASLLTGLYPPQHGVVLGLRATRRMRRTQPTLELNRIPGAVTTLAELLHDAGYRTFGVADNITVCRELGFADGFDRWQTLPYAGAAAVADQILAWAADLAAARPYFLYVHLMDPHHPLHARAPLDAHRMRVQLAMRPANRRGSALPVCTHPRC